MWYFGAITEVKIRHCSKSLSIHDLNNFHIHEFKYMHIPGLYSKYTLVDVDRRVLLFLAGHS